MQVHFDSIKVGSEWDRVELAKLWGYRSFHALARGVFTPTGQNYIVLFVTEMKQETATHYADRLEGSTLYWEGEDGHQNDLRIADAGKTGDAIHVFYREKHHSPFRYLGSAVVKSRKLHVHKPSEFVLHF